MRQVSVKSARAAPRAWNERGVSWQLVPRDLPEPEDEMREICRAREASNLEVMGDRGRSRAKRPSWLFFEPAL